MEFFLLGNPLTSDELHQNGMINSLSDNPIEAATEMAKIINKLSPLSTNMIKKNIKAALDSTFSESMEREMMAQRFLGNSADYKEGLNAFLAKREPQFKGE
jgi:2-(1,2-epoxy-1,2-dihydrophenyl)acetyl-CoA isomerase